MKVVVIWHAGAAFPERVEALARQPDVELTLIVPRVWKKGLVQPALSSMIQQASYRVVPLHAACQIKEVFHFYPSLTRVLRSAKPDVLYLIEEHYSWVTFQALRWRARHSPQTAFAFRTWQNIDKKYPPPFRWTEHYVLRNADGAISANQDGAAILRRKGLQGQLEIIPDGVDTCLFTPNMGKQFRKKLPVFSDGADDSRVLVGFIGRLVPEKGIETLLRAFSEFSSIAQLVIIGSGPMLSQLNERSAALGMQDSVHFVGAVSREEMPKWVAALDVLVLPSETHPNWKEQFGMVLLEAMACGVAVIGSDSGEIPHVIGDAGLIFREGDAEALAKCLKEILFDPTRKDTLAKKGIERVHDLYTSERCSEKTIAFLRGLMQRRTSP